MMELFPEALLNRLLPLRIGRYDNGCQRQANQDADALAVHRSSLVEVK